MTRMLPATVHSSVTSGAERRLFSLLASEKGTEDWVCLHSLGLARHHRKRRAELDFVLLSPLGIFVLEVKGGRIRRDRGEWVFTDRYGNEHPRNESPFAQASSGMFALEAAVRRELGDTPWRDVLFGYGVVFPDIVFTASGTDGAPEIVYDARSRRQSLVEYVRRLAEFARTIDPRLRRSPTRAQIEILANFLRGDFDLVPSFDVSAEETRTELESLTQEQCSVLDAFEDEERLLIDGPAGAGKTVLAMEAARRDARVGRRVLVLCYNRFLAMRLSAALGREDYSGQIVVSTVHALMKSLIDASSLRTEFDEIAAGADEGRLFNELFPEYAALAALEHRSPPMDCLIIDEAQDILTEAYLAPVSEILRGGVERGRWRIFLDANNQASVYGCLDPSLLSKLRMFGPISVLTLNCRNTRPIAQQTNMLSEPKRRAEGRVFGVPVEYLSYTTDSECTAKVRRVLEDLRREQVPAGSISVLFVKQPNEDAVRKLRNMGIRSLEESDIADLGTTRLTSSTWSLVSRFKGLENDVVLLVGVTDIEQPWWRAMTYVGMSRARIRLWVLLHSGCEGERRLRSQRETERQLSSGGSSS